MATPSSGRRRPSEATSSIPDSSTSGYRDPDPPAVGFRLSAAAAPVDPLRAAAPRVRHRGAGDRRRPARLDVSVRQHGVHVVVPRFSARPAGGRRGAARRGCCDGFFRDHRIRDYVLWYYTPMALAFTRHLHAARRGLRLHGRALGLRRRARRDARARSGTARTRRRRLHRRPDPLRGQAAQPSERPRRFRAASTSTTSRAAGCASRIRDDQARIPHPRLGFFGVIDERMDLELLRRRGRGRARTGTS